MRKDHPVNDVVWIPVEKLEANDYNPNSVASSEMNLLYISILRDGYTQPIVTVYDKERDIYVIVDGFHRYLVLKIYKDIYESTEGFAPVVVLNCGIADRMAATVRHNRARGKHSVQGMSKVVFEMLKAGMKDEDICNEIGLEAEELVKLKHITGFSKLFKDAVYGKSWVTDRMIQLEREYKGNNNDAE